MRNNNGAAIRRLIDRSLKSNKKRNFFVIMAIALTTLLIASVFSIGMSLMESVRMQETRLMGTVAHAAVGHPTPAQVAKLNSLDYVKIVGTGNNVAFVKNTPQMGDMSLALHYFDQIEWEKLRAPAFSDIVGNYPQKENEMMVPLWVLERMGIENPSVGMEISLDYYTEGGNSDTLVNGNFRLSGWFTSYMYIRSGNIDTILVSKELSEKYGKTVASDGAATVMFRDSAQVLEDCEKLRLDLELSVDQPVRPVPAYEVDEGSRTGLIALAAVTTFLIFTGYLLIYNVLYISVSRDVRFYGLLKTLGTTPKQIRRIVTGQIMRLCMIGIPIGALLALLFSLVVVPVAIVKLGSTSTGAIVSFSPLIYLGAALFALFTALLGAFKPARKAAGISPIEAQKFTGIDYRRRDVSSSTHGKPYKMAFRNIFRDRKRAVVVLASLFLGVTTFITMTTLVSSMSIDHYIEANFESDFVLKNNTMAGYEEAPKQKFDDLLIEKIKALPGFESLRIKTQEWMRLDYSTDEYGEYVTDFCKRNNIEELSEEAIRKNFLGIIAGVDKEAIARLNETLDTPIDVDAFQRGEFALIATNNPDFFANVHELAISPLHKSESGFEEISGSLKTGIPLGGFVPFFFEGTGFSLAPTIFVSNEVMNRLYPEPMISEIKLEVGKGYDQQTLDALKQIMDGDYELSRTSKLEAMEELKDAKMMLYTLGGGIALIIALIGILNFVNVMSVGVMARKHELATLESVGMTRRQVRNQLLSEGLGYAVITLVLVLTIGSAAAFGIFTLFQQQADYAVFTYPFVPMTIVGMAIIAVCVITPEIAYRSICKMTIVERLREGE